MESGFSSHHSQSTFVVQGYTKRKEKNDKVKENYFIPLSFKKNTTKGEFVLMSTFVRLHSGEYVCTPTVHNPF